VSGFTLIELLVVLLIISIAYAVAVPGVKAVLTGVEVNAAIRELVTDIRYAQQMAIGEGRVYRIIFNKHMNLYRVSYTSYPIQVTVKQVVYPEGLTLLGTSFNNDMLSFNVMGAPSAAGTITLKDNRGKEIRVTVLPATGRVRVYR
jgi:prepilin-type N-terminal cleavage/methylation domain-containing protein